MSSTDPTSTRPDPIDERGRVAAADLRSRAAARPRPPFDLEAAQRLAPAPSVVRAAWHDPRRLAVAAAIVLVVVAGALWASTRGGDDDAPADVTTTEVRPFRLGAPPEGLTLAGAAELPASSGSPRAATTGSLSIYGTSIDEPKVGVAWMGTDSVQPDGGEVLGAVDGRTVRRLDTGGMLPATVVTEAPDGGWVVVVGPDLDDEQLVALAAGAAVDGDRATLSAALLPDGWKELGDDPQGLMGASAGLLVQADRRPGAGPLRTVVYASGDGTEGTGLRTVSVVSTASDEVALASARLLSTDARSVEVRGHPALLTTSGSTGFSAITSLLWFESPGELVRLTATGLGDAELAAVAESVEAIPSDEFADLVERTKLGDLAADGDGRTELGRGEFADGTAWVLREGDGGSEPMLDLQVALTGDSSSSFSGTGSAMGTDAPDAPAMRSMTIEEIGGRRFAAGRVAPEVVRVEVRGADETVLDAVDATPMPDPADGAWFVVELPGAGVDLALVDADGVVVDTVAATSD